MELKDLDPAKVYEAIRLGVSDAVKEVFAKSYSVKASGDRLADAVREGTAIGIETALKTNSNSASPGNLLASAVERGTAQAMRPSEKS